MKVNCDENTEYPLPELIDNKGNLRVFTVRFDNITAEFARYDSVNNKIFIQKELLTANHEGRHIVTLSISYGKGVYKKTTSETLQIIVACKSIKPYEEE